MPGSGRPGAEQRVQMTARKHWREMERCERQIADLTVRATDARAELTRMRERAEAKLGVPVPADAMLLDVLELVDVDGDRWLWTGVRNNKDLPTLRLDRSEVSLVRYLAVAFGVITDEDYGILYPTNDVDDVNPWHRELRRSSGPVGNRRRYAFGDDRP